MTAESPRQTPLTAISQFSSASGYFHSLTHLEGMFLPNTPTLWMYKNLAQMRQDPFQ